MLVNTDPGLCANSNIRRMYLPSEAKRLAPATGSFHPERNTCISSLFGFTEFYNASTQYRS